MNHSLLTSAVSRIRKIKIYRVPAAFALLCVVGGCGSEEEIRRYEAPKMASSTDVSRPIDEADATDRMLAAILPRGQTAWFFKVVGPKDAVGSQADAFRDLVRSVKFEAGRPVWELPEGWKEELGTGIRFATLRTDAGGEELEVSVTSLPKPAGDERAYNLANINRWRGQLNLSAISTGTMENETEQIEYDGGTAIVMDVVGRSGASDMAHPPFAAMARNDSRPPAAEPPAAASSAIEFEAPEEWQPGDLVVSRGGITLRHEAAFNVADGGANLEITVDRIPAAVGLLANVNRWRRQIELEPWTEAELVENTKQFEIDGLAADYVQLPGPKETILGVVAEHDGAAWFIKAKGDKELAERERERFEAFAESIRLP